MFVNKRLVIIILIHVTLILSILACGILPNRPGVQEQPQVETVVVETVMPQSVDPTLTATMTPLPEEPTPTATEQLLPEGPTPTETDIPLLPPDEIEDLLGETEGLFFWFGPVLYRTDLEKFTSEVIFVSEYEPVFSWWPDRPYRAYIEREDIEEGLDRPGGSLVIQTIPEGDFVVYDEMPEDVNTWMWGPEPWQITLSTFDMDAYISMVEDEVIARLQIFDLETGSLETLLTDSDPLIYYVHSWSPDGQYLLYQKALYAAGYYPMSFVIDRETGETTEQPCNHCWWSPNGKSLVGTGHWTYERVDLPLLLVDFPSLAVKELYLRDGYTATGPIWSPGGDWIAFSIYNYDEELLLDHIFLRQDIPLLIDPQGQTLLEIPVMDARPFLWHPEGSQLLLVVCHEQDGLRAGQSLYLYDLETDTVNLIFETDAGSTRGHRFILLGP